MEQEDGEETQQKVAGRGQDIRVTDLVQQFLVYQEDCNHSPKTVRWYSDMLGRLAKSLGPEARLRDIDGGRREPAPKQVEFASGLTRRIPRTSE